MGNMHAGSPISGQSAWVVQGRERAEFVDGALDTGVDHQGAGERAAVYDAMADAGDGFSAEFGRQVGEGCFECVGHDGDALDQAFAEQLVRIRSRGFGRGFVERVLERRAACVEDEDFHAVAHSGMGCAGSEWRATGSGCSGARRWGISKVSDHVNLDKRAGGNTGGRDGAARG